MLNDMQDKPVEAAEGFLKAANLMLPEAACYVGLIYSTGIGLPQNDLHAYRWLLVGTAYAYSEERDFWLDFKNSVASRLNPNEIRTIQAEISELVRKEPVLSVGNRKELLNGNEMIGPLSRLFYLYEPGRESATRNRQNTLESQYSGEVSLGGLQFVTPYQSYAQPVSENIDSYSQWIKKMKRVGKWPSMKVHEE